MSGHLTVGELHRIGLLRDVDLHFARTIARLAGTDDPLVLLGLAVASRAPGAGHVCADLSAPGRIVRLEDADAESRIGWPSIDRWCEALRKSEVVRLPDEAGRPTPLVLDGRALYLDRYWRYQEALIAELRTRAAVVRTDVDESVLAAGLERLFPQVGAADPQREAAAVAVRRSLAVITGGPGTGKTTTVLRILALLLEQSAARGEMPRIALAAPTGKAASRMAEAIRQGLDRLPIAEQLRQSIPVAASTLHRLLRWQPATPTTFVHGADDPLAADIVVVDEVSMVDLALMTKLVRAVRPGARLVLLGDRDQLASVEAGAILGDICPEGHNLPEGPLRPCSVRLLTSHRFRADGKLAALARAMRTGEVATAQATLDEGGEVELIGPEAAGPDLSGIRTRIVEAYRPFLEAATPDEALEAMDRFRILCAHREGPLGVQGVNEAVARWCERAGLLEREGGEGWHHRRPIIVTENDRSLELFNGDTGVLFRGDDGRIRAWFRAADGAVRAIAPARLPRHDAVFAMTVHKSQGSELDRVMLVLPARPSPVLTRELLYTAVTRARQGVTIVGDRAVLAAGIADRVQRASGLRDKLWGRSGAGVGSESSAASRAAPTTDTRDRR